MKKTIIAYPLVDLFAGPGGLGEGFAMARGERDEPRFESVVAIERDEFSHQTLLLRHFLRHFPADARPDDYYEYLRGEIDRSDLYRRHKAEFKKASASALKISLGPENHATVKRLINKRIGNCQRWALVGGPPCQAYSLVGRSRMMGRPGFEQDERHFLYLEYLKIIIDHQPPVFVMENVKGLLSAKIGGEPIINRIVGDLSSPKKAVGNSANGLGYKLYSLSEDERPGEEVDPRLFLVRAEEYGVPQARHRMFIVGVRNDINVRPGRLRPHAAPTLRQTIGSLPAVRSNSVQGRRQR
ncbi:MAG: DNA cytosine methyltransferase [Pseudomonadales bacterium]